MSNNLREVFVWFIILFAFTSCSVAEIVTNSNERIAEARCEQIRTDR